MGKELLKMMIKDQQIINEYLSPENVKCIAAAAGAAVEGHIATSYTNSNSPETQAAASISAARGALKESCRFLISCYNPESEVDGMDTFLELSSILHEEIDKYINGGSGSPPPLVA